MVQCDKMLRKQNFLTPSMGTKMRLDERRHIAQRGEEDLPTAMRQRGQKVRIGEQLPLAAPRLYAAIIQNGLLRDIGCLRLKEACQLRGGGTTTPSKEIKKGQKGSPLRERYGAKDTP